MKKIVSLLMIVCILSVCLISCGSKSDDALLGTWNFTAPTEDSDVSALDMSFTFEKDGKASITVSGISVPATYKIDGDKLSVTPDVESSETVDNAKLEAKYSIDGDTLKLEDVATGVVTELKKSK